MTTNVTADLAAEEKRRLLAELLSGAAEPELYPLTFAQHRIWFLEQLSGSNNTHNLASALRLKGTLNRDALQRAFESVVERHDSLRTVFVAVDGEPKQKVLPPNPQQIEYLDLRQETADRREQTAYTLACEEAGRPFDLGNGPLIRLRLLQLSDTEHILTYTAHHICTDGASLAIFVQELAAFYDAALRGTEADVPELPIQYGDYADWQRSTSDEETHAGQIAYWKERLAGIPALLELPTDRIRPAEESFAGNTITVPLPSDLVASASGMARGQNATLFSVFLAAFVALLHRYSRQDDICVGMPIAGRTQVETENLIGLLVNTIVIRTNFDENTTFADLVRQVRDRILEADANQDVPFERLVEELNPRRSLAYHPIFQVMATAFRSALPVPRFGPLDASEYFVSTGSSRFDMSVEFVDDAAGNWVWTAIYNTALFDESRIRRMFGHFQVLLAAAAAHSQARVAELPLLDEEEAQQLARLNDTAVAFPHACVHELIRASARRHADRVAIQFGGESVTYSELEELSDRLAKRLRAAGAVAGGLVAVCLSRSIDMVAGVLAVMKTGCAYVPMDPDYPLERLALMMEDSGAKVLLTERNLMPELERSAGSVVYAGDPITDAEAAAQLEESFDPETLAYLIYTSGSTGKPKGVAIPHRAVVNLLCSMQREPGLSVDDALLAVTTVCFDIAGLEMYLPLITGARVVVVSRETAVDGPALLNSIRQYGITVMQATPTTWRLLIEAGWNQAQRLKVLCGGEALPAELARQLTERSDSVWNVYGPTETTIWSSCSQVRPDEAITIGKPIDNTQFYVLDSYFRPVPIGVSGELYIGGSGLAQGYWNRSELTAEKFVSVPAVADGKLYRTGDEVRLLENGNYEYQRRVDSQVKVRGFRIELGEIETALTKVEGVRQAVVVVREDTPGDTRLIGYAVLEDGAALTRADIQERLRRTLPDYMVPYLMILDAFPLTANGKVDRKQLPAPDMEPVAAEVVAPQTGTEIKLAEIWRDSLRVASVGLTDDFFSLGGHSLLAVKMIARARTEFGVEINMRTLFEDPTIAGFAAAIDKARQSGAGSAATHIPRSERRKGATAPEDLLFPATSPQQRIWLIEEFEPNYSISQNISIGMRLSGDLNRGALEQAFTRVVERQESLRTVFVAHDGEPKLRVLPLQPQTIEYVDLRYIPAEQREAETRALACEEGSRRFNLESGPLVRLKLLQQADTEYVLVCTVHHICSDGTSVVILIQELETFYNAQVSGTEAALPPLPIQFGDFAEWAASAVNEERDARQVAYWKERLAGAPELLELPTDHTRPAAQSFKGHMTVVPIPSALVAGATAVARRENATLFSVFLATLAVLLHRYSRQDDILIGVPVAGRNLAETENLIGMFVNPVVVRVNLAGQPPFSDIVKQVRDSILEADANSDVSFDRIVDELRPNRSFAYNPIFQVLATSYPSALPVPRFGPLSAVNYPIITGGSSFDLMSIFMDDAEGNWEWEVTYNNTVFESSRIQRMLRHYEVLLEAIAAGPDTKISDLPLLAGEEVAQIASGNDTTVPFPNTCVHELIRTVARQSPDRVAIQFDDRSMTYAELDDASDRLARRLRSAGAASGSLVGVCLSRSAEMVVGLLAVLKSGCAYVPMDPDYPVQRLRLMMEDSGSAVLLTERMLVPELSDAAERVVFIEDPSSQAEDSVTLEESFDPESLAYVIYTSGSTGKPKGVAIPHRAVVNLLCSMQREPGLTADDALLAVTTICFDIAGLELFLPLISGARVVIATRDAAVDGRALLENLKRHGITMMQATPATWRLLIEAGWDSSQRLKVLCGGEALPSDLALQLTERSYSVWNVYGPTETTIWSSCSQVHPGEPITIGKPIDNTTFYVLDAAQQPVPIGVNGELYIGGSGLARGYWRRPELTQEKFVSIPWIAGGATLYRTGDEVRLLDDGNYQYHRRIDFQVKVRGFRIELGEIETALTNVAGVRQSVVVVREDTPGDTRLIGYVVLEPGAELTAAQIQAQLKQTLPDYMAPFLMILDAFPLTANGKVDRKQLPAPDVVATASEIVAPRDEVEAKLVEIWQQVLKLPRIGIRDDFFDNGGHSLLAVRMLARVRDEFGMTLPLAMLFREGTVEHLAAVITNRQRSPEPASTLLPLRTHGSHPPLFVGGSSPAYAQLAQLLGDEQPVYKMDLYAVGEQLVANGDQPYKTFSEYVNHFLAEVRKVQPKGPYYLGGGCGGGVLALEMARQLQKAGESVAMLIIWDTPRTGFFRVNKVRRAMQLTQKAARAFAAGELPWLIRHRLVSDAQAAQELTPEQQRYVFVYDSIWDTISDFWSDVKFNGRIVFVQAEKQYAQYYETSEGWEDLATEGIDLHVVPGDHESYMKEHMETFGATVRELIAKAHAEERASASVAG